MEQLNWTESLRNVGVEDSYLEVKKKLIATEEQVEKFKVRERDRERDCVQMVINHHNQLSECATDLSSVKKKYAKLKYEFNEILLCCRLRKYRLEAANAEIKRLRSRSKELEDQSEEEEGMSQKTEEHLSAEKACKLKMQLEEMAVAFADMKASLSDKIQSLTKENEFLKRKDSDNDGAMSNALALAEAARVAKEEALARLGNLTEEADKRSREYAQELDAAEAANADLRAELWKLNQQFGQDSSSTNFE